SVVGSLPPGVSANVSPNNLSLPSNGSATFTFALAVDNGRVPNVPTDPFAYEGEILATRSGETLHLPFAFIKAPALTLHFDQEPWIVTVTDNVGYWRWLQYPTVPIVMRVPPTAPLDVLTIFPDGVSIVVREG